MVDLEKLTSDQLIDPITGETEYSYEKAWDTFLKIRSAVLKALEEARKELKVGHSLDGWVELHVIPEMMTLSMYAIVIKSRHQDMSSFLKELCIVSEVFLYPVIVPEMKEIESGIFVHVVRAKGVKCPRCWHWNQDKKEDDLCLRCVGVLKKDN